LLGIYPDTRGGAPIPVTVFPIVEDIVATDTAAGGAIGIQAVDQPILIVIHGGGAVLLEETFWGLRTAGDGPEQQKYRAKTEHYHPMAPSCGSAGW